MMGSRGYRGGDECEAFYARRTFPWRKQIRLLKRKFWKRQRREAKRQARR
jgi:hypothetical protein